MISKLVEALKAEFKDEVIFSAALPSTITAPAVIVTPGDPFIAPNSVGVVEEVWDVLVAVSVKEPAPGIEQMRDLSLRVRRVVTSHGATWRQASAPRRVSHEKAQTVVSLNTVAFKYVDPPSS